MCLMCKNSILLGQVESFTTAHPLCHTPEPLSPVGCKLGASMDCVLVYPVIAR